MDSAWISSLRSGVAGQSRQCAFDLRADPATGNAPACDKANELKKQVFSFTYDNGKNYINLKALFKPDGTGISQQCRRESMAVYEKYGIKLGK